MPFSKFDPDRPAEDDEPEGTPRTWLLKYGWWITLVYTAFGFGMIAYWLIR